MKHDTLAIAASEGRAPWTLVRQNTNRFVVFEDMYPVTDGHVLVVPKEATMPELANCLAYATEIGSGMVGRDNVTGYNVGLNMGESAGQTCMYPHVHVIFRRDGDCADPTGGVRNVIPGQGDWQVENDK